MIFHNLEGMLLYVFNKIQKIEQFLLEGDLWSPFIIQLSLKLKMNTYVLASKTP